MTCPRFEYGPGPSGATFSPCGRFRYTLFRRWDDRPPLVVCMLNPSTADETENDPTITRVIKRAEDAGRGGLIVVNLFAFRSTDPKALKKSRDIVGPHNDDAIRWAAGVGGHVVCGWGTHGGHVGRGWIVTRKVLAGVPLFAFDLCQDGTPRHPLYLRYGDPLRPINDAARGAIGEELGAI